MTTKRADCTVPARVVLDGTKTEPCGKGAVAEVDMRVAGRTIHFDLCLDHADELQAVDVPVAWWADVP